MIVVLAFVEAWMILVTLDRPTPGLWGFRGYELTLALAFGSVGALIAARRPENRIGWLILGAALLTGAAGIVDQYPFLSDGSGAAPPLAGLARWISAWIWVIGSVAFTSLLPLLFPDGRLVTKRWRFSVWLTLIAAVTLVGSIILAVEPLGPLPASPMAATISNQLSPLMVAGFMLYLGSALVSVASVVVRYRRAGVQERQQLKWVAYAGALIVPAAVAGLSPIFLGQFLLLGAGVFAAAAIAVAILRYRLYEIDLIINRTLVYGALTAILAGVYTASIALSQRIFSAVTGDRSDAAIVLTTLIVVSLFAPIKSRLQAIVDARLKTVRPSVVGVVSASPLDVLTRLDSLRLSGVITAADFETAKHSLLARAVQEPATTDAVQAG